MDAGGGVGDVGLVLAKAGVVGRLAVTERADAQARKRAGCIYEIAMSIHERKGLDFQFGLLDVRGKLS